MPILILDCPVMPYAWGTRTDLAALQGRPTPTEAPEAELWVGAHPKAPARVNGRSLEKIIADDPVSALGDEVSQRYGGRLPFLLKLLSVAEPLSIQAHPNANQALKGYHREQQLGCPIDAAERNYRDESHKPEVVLALGDFWALNGFRPVPEVLGLLKRAGLDALADERRALSDRPNQAGMREFFSAIMGLCDRRTERVLGELEAGLQRGLEGSDEARWIKEIIGRYPGDIGALCVLLLNLVQLRRGDLMPCPAGCLHAYLRGFCVELMANSDNVLRGGLTPKHVDVPELLSVLSFEPSSPPITRIEEGPYLCPSGEYQLELVTPSGEELWESPAEHALDLILVLSGTLSVATASHSARLSAGGAAALPSTAGGYHVRGPAVVVRASTPLSDRGEQCLARTPNPA